MEACMAVYKDGNRLEHSQDAAFDAIYKPGDIVPYSGIYRCTSCNDEVACNAGDPFPPQNHHQHSPPALIRWRLLVAAIQK